MYALQVGGGCESDTDTGVQCDLTDALGVGPQCSAKQFKLIREWFIDIPQISGHQPDDYKNIRRPDVLEKNCYSSPITATFQEKWEKIRVKQDGAQVSVDAVGSYLARGDSGQFHYRSTYKVEGHSITVVSHERLPTKKRHQDPDEDDAGQ